MSPRLGPVELLRNCFLDWAPSGANKKLPPGQGPGSFLKKLQWVAVFLCQIEYGVIAIFFSYLCKDFVKHKLKARARRQSSNAWLEMTYSSEKKTKEQYHQSISLDTITIAVLVAPDASNQA